MRELSFDNYSYQYYLYFFRIKEDETKNDSTGVRDTISLNKDYDWDLILKAISPLILISIGAGLTIPFVNLFFNSIFHFHQVI